MKYFDLFFRNPPDGKDSWSEYFENHFSAPAYHIGWNKVNSEELEGSTPEEFIKNITEKFEGSGIQSYSQVCIDTGLYTESNTLNNYFSEHGVLLPER